MKELYFLLSCLLLSIIVSAQRISGIVINSEGLPLSNSTVSLLRANDSSLQKLSVTKDGGEFSFSINNKENYIISASYTGYRTMYSTTLDLAKNKNVNDIRVVLPRLAMDLKAVTVTAKRPMLEVKADKMIMNVEGTINAAGSDAFELLRKAPAVTVDNNDNIILAGKTGTQIFIDGKPSPLTGSDLSGYLKSIQSAQIESIEIITNPSAKYEAAGNAGIINIRFKKNKSFGTNGSVNAGYGIGVFSKYNAGFSLNYRNKKVNIFSTYSYSNVINEINTTGYRIQHDTIFDGGFGRFIHDKGHNIKAGMDYFLNKATTLGVIITVLPGSLQMDEPGETFISSAVSNKLVKRLVANSINDTKRSNSNINLNYRYEQKDKELNIDVDYGKYWLTNERLQPNAYYNVSNDYLYGSTYSTLTPVNINLASLKINNVRNFNGGKLDIGGKTSYVSSENNFQRFDVGNNAKQMDSSRSNNFNYRENINALYVNYNKDYKDLLWQVGVRMENTIISGNSSGFRLKNNFTPFDSSFNRNYTDFFPSVAITWKKDKNSQIGLSYSKRIDRPVYQNLNPFEYPLDEYTYRKGNTNLQPQYTNSVGISYTYKSKLTAILNYSSIRSMFAQLFDTAERTKSFITITNIGKQDLVNLNVNYIVQAKRFSAFFNLNSFYAHSIADFGKGRTIDLSTVTVNVRSQQAWQFGKTYTAELVEYYTSPYIFEGTFKSKSMGSMDVGLQKILLNGKATLKASVTDIFYTMQSRLENHFAGQNQYLWRAWEPHLFRINATYRFGSSQIKAGRQRKTGLEEESKRVQSGS